MRLRRWGYLSLVATSLLCSGCWDSTEINQLGIVTATGIELVNPGDPHSESRAYAQVASPSQLVNGPNGGGGPTDSKRGFVLEEGVGLTAASSLASVQRLMSRRFFFRDRRVVIIGERFARRGIGDLLDAMVRNPDSRFRCFLLISDGCRPSDILRMSYPLTRLPADAMVELEESGQGVVINAVQFVRTMTRKSDPYAMGIRIVRTTSSTQKGMFELADVAVFKHDRMVGWLRKDAAHGFFVMQPQSDRLKLQTLDVRISSGGWITTRLIVLKKYVRLHWTSSGPSANIHLEISDDVMENSSVLSLDEVTDVRRAEQAIENRLTTEMKATLDLLQHHYGADCLGLGDALFSRFPTQWRKIEPHWEQVYRQMPISVSVDAHLVRSGITGRSFIKPAHS
ncbi:MAG: Ger(x)C family spore germination protein [Firmicutes bacterium]|nr:Ger(x)C family spore germination protein [Bacillota bacterium]